MSFLSDFERRIGSVFGAAPQGYTEPFSFKKLAKRAAREMENETYEIDGVDTAPALYTVLVSSSDDSLMRPLYEQITYEISNFVTAQAQKRGYAFVGSPLVRFMVDPSLRSGKFAVFAENVDARTLNLLREEERVFLAGNSSAGGAAAKINRRPSAQQPLDGAGADIAVSANVSAAPVPSIDVAPASSSYDPSGMDAGLDVMPSDYYVEPDPVASVSDSTPMPVAMVTDTPMAPLSPVAVGTRPSVQVPKTQLRNVPLVNPKKSAAAAAPVASAANAAPAASAPAHAASAQHPARVAESAASCLLIDRQTGRTYTAKAPSTVIGREPSRAGVVLRDPNVSRTHAQLSYDGRDWHITDLNSTNGTLVNDCDIQDCVLRDGDLITLGLINLEFRENH